jgi:hypothetical protein
MTINDEMAQEHAALKKICADHLDGHKDRYVSANSKVFDDPVDSTGKKKKSVPVPAGLMDDGTDPNF